MKKSRIIAQCLYNSNMFTNIDHAEFTVKNIFEEEFPDKDYDEWNSNIYDITAEKIIAKVGKASFINVKYFIEDLN